ASGDKTQLTEQLIKYQNQYNDEKSKRKILEKQLQAPHNDSTQLPNQITSDEKPKTVPSH
ncbi:unnamed protein product, partial [Rotaria magnacalcarata]